MNGFIITVLIGFLFGFALQKTGLGHYDTVVNQFRFKDNTMMKFMCSAISVGSVTYFLFQPYGLTATVPAVSLAGTLVGGVVFGAGMAIAGTCPGTVIAGIGQGNIDYLTAGFTGFIAGSFIFGVFFKFFFGITMAGFIGNVTLGDITGLNPWLFIDVICATVICFYVISSWKARK